MIVILALCSAMLGLVSLFTWFAARAKRKQRLAAGVIGENRTITKLLREGFPREHLASSFLVTGKNGSRAELDLVVKVGDVAVVVETKNWSGFIDGGSKDKEWKATKKNGMSIIHRNPLSQASRQARLLYEATGQGAVGIVLMAGSAKHSEGHFPEGVASMDTLVETIRHAVGKLPLKQTNKHAWDTVASLAARPTAAAEAKAYGAFLHSIIGHKPWLSWLALGAVTAAAVIFIQDNTAYSLERAMTTALHTLGMPH